MFFNLIISCDLSTYACPISISNTVAVRLSVEFRDFPLKI